MKASKKRGVLALVFLSPALLLLSGCSNSNSNCDPNHPTPGSDNCNGTMGHSGSGYFGSSSHSFGSGSQSEGSSARGGFGESGHGFGGGGHGGGGGGGE